MAAGQAPCRKVADRIANKKERRSLKTNRKSLPLNNLDR